MTKENKKSLRLKIILAIAFAGIVVLLGWFLLTEENIDIIVSVFTNDDLTNEEIQDRLSNLGIRGNITISILSMLQVILTFVPSEPTQVLAGMAYGFWHGLACCMVGVFLGNSAVFLLYKMFGEKLNAYFDRELHLNVNKLSNSHVVTLVIIILYLLPVIPYGIICFLAATLRMKFPKYTLVTLLGSLPSEAIGVILGHAALAQSWVLSVSIFAGLVVLIILFFIKKKAVMAWLNDFIDNYRDRLSGRFTVKQYHKSRIMPPYIASRILMHGKIKVKYTVKAEFQKPSITLVNHGSFIDFAYAGAMLRKYSPNFIVARLYFYKHLFRNFLRSFGCFPKSMFCSDLESAKNCLQVLKKGGALAMMPEARLSTVGRFEDIQEGTYSFLKKAGVPVYYIKLGGDYFARPKWGDKMRKGSLVEAELDILFTAEELSALSVEEIKDRVEKALYYDEFEWIKSHPEIHYKSKTLAKGLENILTLCPHCKERYTMATEGMDIYCEGCGARFTLNDRYGFEENGCFTNFAEWYEWQREAYRNEIIANPDFALTSKVELKNNSKNGKTLLYTAGQGVCTLNREGLTYVGTRDGEEFTKHFPMSDIYRLLFGAGEDFEIYEGKEIYYFVPEEKRSCVDWYIVSGLLKEPAVAALEADNG